MPDLSLESFCSYMEEIGFINIDLLSDFLESYNHYKKKPLQEALFVSMIKFFRDNYICNEDNLNRLCKRLIESYNKSIALKKAESIKKFTFIINSKQNSFKSLFLANFKSRNQIETVMRRHVKGYSRDKIRLRKMSRSNSNLCSPYRDLSESRSNKDFSYSQYSNNNLRSINNRQSDYNHQERTMNHYNTINSSVYNNTSGSNLRSNYYNTDKSINRSNSKINFSGKKNFEKKINENSTSNVFERLNSNSKISKRKSLNNTINDFIPSKELKEMKELEQCTFQPKINYYYPSCNNSNSRHYKTFATNTEEDINENVHDKLFREQVRLKEKKNIKCLEKMINDSKILTFQPYISPTSNVLAKKSRSRSFNNTFNRSVDKVFDRFHNDDKTSQDSNVFLKNMQKYQQASEKNKMENYIKRQKELNREYTYSPNINKNYNSNNFNNSSNVINNFGSYDFSYLNYKVLNNESPMNKDNLPAFIRVANNNSRAKAIINNCTQVELSSNHNFERSRSRSKSKSKNKGINNHSRKNNRNIQIMKNQYDRELKKSEYNNQHASSNSDTEINIIPNYKRTGSLNDLRKAKINNVKHEKIDNNINLILHENLNKNRIDNNDYHFNYDFRNDYISTDTNNAENNLYLENDKNRSNSKEVFEKLYSQAEEIKLKKLMLSNEVYSEKYGITFKPKINNSSKYSINLDFHARDMNFVKSKRENMERLIKESKEKELSTIRKSRTLSKEEKERNTLSVVERLYKRQIEKLNEKKAKKIEEEKKAEAELKKRKKSKEEIELNNKIIVERLYSSQIDKIKEQFNNAKNKFNNEELQKNLEMIENQNLNKIKENNKKKYSTVQSRIFKDNRNNNQNVFDNENKSISPSHIRQNKTLLNKLKKEHKIKFKNEDLSSLNKSKEKKIDFKNNLSETRIKKTEDSSPNKNSILNNEISRNGFNLADSINSNNNRNSLLQSNSSIGEKIKKSSNSKIIKPIRAADFDKKNNINSSDYLLESNNIYYKKSESKNSIDDNSNKKFETKKNSSIKDYANLSPINNENNHSSIEINALSNKSSFRDGVVNQNNILHFENSVNSKSNAENFGTLNNNSNTKETSVTNNSRNNKYEFSTNKDNYLENNVQANSDNSENSRGLELKENKFKSKGLEKILNSRK